MEFLQLKYFQVVARTEHMTRAAEELHIAQPSLSKTIARLEETVGVPLFDRQKRGIKLNQFGKAFLQRVERAFAELEEGQRVVADMAGLERGSITLGATTTRLLPNLFGEFLTDHPHVSFRLLNLSSSEVLDKLESGEIAWIRSFFYLSTIPYASGRSVFPGGRAATCPLPPVPFDNLS